jgi:hypothetical protein
MTTFPGKHQFGSIGDTRVTFVEKKIPAERMEFLKKLLEHNGFEVVIQEEKVPEGEAPLYTIGVTDMVFNPSIWVYERRLKTPDGHIVTKSYWFQEDEDTKPQYWEKR